MQLENYISDLLYRYECVVLPEFGAFLTESQSAIVNPENNTFYPPKKVISFNEQIQKNDGLLIQYISDVEKIPFEIASEKIRNHVKTLKRYLVQGESITLKNIGELIFNKEGKILFEPFYNLNYLTDAFGLSQFEYVAPSAPVVITPLNPVANSIRETHKETVKHIEKGTPISITQEKRKTNTYLKYAAIALIALTIAGIGASKYYVNNVETHNQIAQEEANQKLETKIQEATFNLDALPAITLNVTKQTGNYHVIAGAFRVEDNCDKKVYQLKALGYNARKIGVNKYGLHQVVYSSYETRNEAKKALRVIKKTHNKDAWLLVKKLN